MTKNPYRLIGASTIATIAGLAIAATASAHVGVEADGDAVAGQPTRLVFSVPNERDDSGTVSIAIQMPQDVDLTDVVPDEVEGWTITATTRDGDIVDTITWDATGPGLVGEDSVELPVAVGPLPAVESLTFPTVQTYDDGEVVRWIEAAPPGEPEPELPVPTLEVTPASPDATTAPSATPSPTAPATEPVATSATEPPTSETDAVVATTASADTTPDTATITGATEISPSSTAVEADDDDGSPVWPWVVVGAIVVVVVGGSAAIARRRTSG